MFLIRIPVCNWRLSATHSTENLILVLIYLKMICAFTNVLYVIYADETSQKDIFSVSQGKYDSLVKVKSKVNGVHSMKLDKRDLQQIYKLLCIMSVSPHFV